jgi:hypothetical protein
MKTITFFSNNTVGERLEQEKRALKFFQSVAH